MMPQPLVQVTRGKIVEAVHFGDIVVVDQKGDVVYSRGDPELPSYYRSSAKPLQAAAAILREVDTSYGLDEKQIAFLCSSHSGEEAHLETALRVLNAFGLAESDLTCGASFPISRRVTDEMLRRGIPPSRLHHNCSGKHMAMLAQCRLAGWPIEGYYRPEHPVQGWITDVIAQFCAADPQSIALGCDGCGVPVHGVTLRQMAVSYQRLATAGFADAGWARACRVIVSAMTGHPFLIAGEGRFDSLLMERCAGEVVAKTGAEGLFCLGVTKGGLGAAVKIRDGSQRGMEPLIVRVLSQLSCLAPEMQAALAPFARQTLRNGRDEPVGVVEAAF